MYNDVFLMRQQTMNDRQKNILKNLRTEAHIARGMGIAANNGFYAKLNAMNAGKNPVFKSAQGATQKFEAVYKVKQAEFWNDLVTIANKKLKELE